MNFIMNFTFVCSQIKFVDHRFAKIKDLTNRIIYDKIPKANILTQFHVSCVIIVLWLTSANFTHPQPSTGH